MRWFIGFLAGCGAMAGAGGALAEPQPFVAEAGPSSLIGGGSWPGGAFRLGSGKFGLDVRPRLAAAGGSRPATGALLRFGAWGERRLFEPPGSDRNLRTYLFAGTRRVTLAGGRRSFTGPVAERFGREGTVKQIQAGFAARRAGLQAALGYTREKVVLRGLGEQVRQDNRVGLTLTLR